MTVTLEEMIAEESQESRERIFELVREMREEMRLRELRRFRRLTQTRLSKKLKIGQEGISRMEKRADMYISTLRGYVEGWKAFAGGRVSGYTAGDPGWARFERGESQEEAAEEGGCFARGEDGGEFEGEAEVEGEAESQVQR